ncbi:MAG: hypothetical protein AB7U46_09805 [Paenirhodobacter sp.]|uniref:hypothetical protein n=1 Tax=Paenirhodobacter sp. TaxID=1965326 RepID=UPI003D0A048D
MTDWFKTELRHLNAEARARNAAQEAARAELLDPWLVTRWTEIVARAARHVTEGRRICDYGPWTRVLREQCRTPPLIGRVSDTDSAEALSHIAAEIAQPGWPDPRPDLIDFALTFLEADVMLFRSGYTKRHLIRRLQQAPLDAAQIARAGALIRRAVTAGTGLEEARAYRKFAAHLIAQGHLPDLPGWLQDQARGTVLSWNRLDGGVLPLFKEALSRLSEADQDRLNWHFPGIPPRYALEYPDRPVPLRRQKEEGQKARFSAFRMLVAIEARARSAPKR